jgi:hypothetical protein
VNNFADCAPSGALVVVERASGPVFEAKWRRGGRQVKRRLGPAWLERDLSGAWRARRGRMPEGFLDEKRATVRMATLVAEHDASEREIERGERERRERGVTFREVATDWLVTWSASAARSRQRFRTTATCSASPGRRIDAGAVAAAAS